MANSSTDLFWNSESLAKILPRKGIHTREDLAKFSNCARTTVYRVFAPDWSGKATPSMIHTLSRSLNVPLNRLLKDPRQ